MKLEIRNLTKAFGGLKAMDDTRLAACNAAAGGQMAKK